MSAKSSGSKSKKSGPFFNDNEFYFIPLGGSEQFGVNLNLYGYKGKWLLVDCGIGFATTAFPGVDILLPDPAFIEQRAKDLAGLIVTHAHEDHIGAVPHLWHRLKCPIYTTGFSAEVLKRKADEAPQMRGAQINVAMPGETVELGPFRVQFVHVSHSIPDACALIIETDAGRIVHSADWNLDPTPVLGPVTDADAFRQAGRDGVLAYIGDSTNAEVPGRAGSESEVEAGLKALFAECRNRILVTVFASNIARVQSIARAAKACGRNVVLVGRSLHNMVGSAYERGLLQDVEFVSEEEYGYLPKENTVVIATGSQGEYRAALARIARGEHREIKLARGDTVVFSSRAIPGNETDINAVKNNLSAAGINIVTPNDTRHCIHVSGHPCRDEIADMIQWTRPATVIPVHGERTQLEAQAALARECQVENVIVPRNGAVIRLAPGLPELVAHVETGLLAVEATRVVAADHPAIVTRRKLQYTGAVHVTLVMDRRGVLAADPQVSTLGLIDEDNDKEAELLDSIMGEVEDIVEDMEPSDRKSDHAVHEEIRIGVRRLLFLQMKVKPKTTVHVVRV
jgi:ribonuclease J